ncbi:MAG: hypothetical protein MN733_38135 [Nitrososphaera sp.]|nr:hypothetical protein [Nitrososphaera sp.]
MAAIFLEILFDAQDLTESDIEGRDEIEDAVSAALSEGDLGEVSGGGQGSGFVNVDVEIDDEENFVEALSVIRETLRGLNVPLTTRIKRYKPQETIYPVYP